MSKQQTAVEWLSEQFDSIVELYPSQFERVNRAIEQAKEMEREQMIDFANDLLAQNDPTYIASPNLAENYYNETYGGNK
jgi:hypothetical protein